MPVRRIHHVQLAMPPGGEDRATAFYTDLLGVRQVPKPAALAARGGCWFEDGAVRIHLGVEEPFRPAAKAHPALVVDGLATLVRALEVAGFAVGRDQPLAGFDRVYVQDPFGNRLELMEPIEGG